MTAQIKKYFVNHNMRFNLDSMRTHCQVLMYQMEDGEIDKVELDGKVMDIEMLDNFIHEIEDLMDAAWGKVTGRQYGRIKQISDERNLIRYATCLNNGMSEDQAALAFFN